MTQEEYRAAKGLKEPETPQAPQMGAKPETPPAKTEKPTQLPEQTAEGDLPPETPPEKTPEQRALEGEAEYRRKLHESETKANLLQQQMNFTQQQLLESQQQNKPQPTVPQQVEMPEFEDPQQALKWMREDNARQRKVEMDALRADFKETNLKADREQAAGRIMESYPDMNNSASLLHQRFTQECYNKGINPQTADPLMLESLAALSAAKCGILPQTPPQNIQPRQPLQQTRPAIPNTQKPAGPKPPDSLPELTQRQLNWSQQLGRDPKEVQQFMKTNEKKYIRANGEPLYPYRRSNQL